MYAILILIAGVLVARAFGADGFGQYSLFLTILAIAIPVGSLGANYAMIEWSPKLSSLEMHAYAGRLLGTVTLVSFVVAFTVAGLMAWYGTVLWSLAWIVLPATLRVALLGYLQGRGQQVIAGIIDAVILPFLLCAILFGAIQSSLNLRPTLTLALGVSYTSAVVVCLIVLRKSIILSRPSLKILSEASHRRSLVAYSATALFAPIVSQIDRFFLIGIRDAATLGPYAAAQNLMNLVIYGTTAAIALILPTIAAGLAGKRSRSHMIISCKRFARVIFAFSAVASLGAIVFGDHVLALFSPEFSSAHSSLVILMLGMTTSLYFGFATSVLTMSQHRATVVWSMALAAVLTVAACIILIPLYGALGAAVANALGMISSRVLTHIALMRRYGFNVSIL